MPLRSLWAQPCVAEGGAEGWMASRRAGCCAPRDSCKIACGTTHSQGAALQGVAPGRLLGRLGALLQPKRGGDVAKVERFVVGVDEGQHRYQRRERPHPANARAARRGQGDEEPAAVGVAGG